MLRKKVKKQQLFYLHTRKCALNTLSVLSVGKWLWLVPFRKTPWLESRSPSLVAKKAQAAACSGIECSVRAENVEDTAMAKKTVQSLFWEPATAAWTQGRG